MREETGMMNAIASNVTFDDENHLRWLKNFLKWNVIVFVEIITLTFCSMFTLPSFFFKTCLRSLWDEVKLSFVLIPVFISFRPSFICSGSVHVVQSWSSGNDAADRGHFLRDTVACNGQEYFLCKRGNEITKCQDNYNIFSNCRGRCELNSVVR